MASIPCTCLRLTYNETLIYSYVCLSSLILSPFPLYIIEQRFGCLSAAQDWLRTHFFHIHLQYLAKNIYTAELINSTNVFEFEIMTRWNLIRKYWAKNMYP